MKISGVNPSLFWDENDEGPKEPKACEAPEPRGEVVWGRWEGVLSAV